MVAESLVDIKENSSVDSSQISACVAPVPLLIIKPESKVGVPDCVDAKSIIGSLTVKFVVLTVVEVPDIIKLPETETSPVTDKVEPSNVKFVSTVAFGAVVFKVITPLFVVPVKLNKPEDPDVPLEPDVPEDPEDPDVPEDPE